MRHILTLGGRFVVPLVLSTLAAFAFASEASAAPRGLYVSSTNGLVWAFSINADGSLQSRGVPGTGGSLTEGLAVTPDAKNVYVANFSPGTGSVAAFNVGPVDNLLSVSGSPFVTGFGNPLGLAPDPNGRWLFAWNHGNNTIGVSAIVADGSLANISGSPFAVPANLTNPFAGSVAPDGQHLYVPNENATPVGGVETDMVTVYSVASGGAVTPLQSIPTGNPSAAGSNPFGSAITPDGKFLYVSNPNDGPNGTLSGFAVNADGMLTTLTSGFPLDVSPGNHPLDMAVSPDGAHLYVATQMSGTINAYDIASDGSLSPITGQPFSVGQAATKALALTPDGKRLYITSNTGGNVTGFDVNADGSLTKFPGLPFGVGTPDLASIAITPNQPPVAGFSAQAAPAGQPSSFDGSGSSDSDGTVANYRWDFGDGRSLSTSSATTTHVYTRPGTYVAQLTVTDNEGCSTQRVFTGKAMLCNGSSVGATTTTITVSPPPPPPSPPAVATTAATGVTQTAAILTGTVNPTGTATSYHFDLGTTTGYGTIVPIPDAVVGADNTVHSVAQSITGLAPKTTYHVRIVATNPGGKSIGADHTFTTLAPVPGVNAPVLSGLSLRPSRFRAAGRGGAIAAQPTRTRPGMQVSYTDSMRATTTLTIVRKAAGVRRGRRCRTLHGKAPKHSRRCTLVVTVGRFTHADQPGQNTFRFTGRIRGRKLAPRPYTLRAVAGSAGGLSKAVTAHFRIIR